MDDKMDKTLEILENSLNIGAYLVIKGNKFAYTLEDMLIIRYLTTHRISSTLNLGTNNIDNFVILASNNVVIRQCDCTIQIYDPETNEKTEHVCSNYGKIFTLEKFNDDKFLVGYKDGKLEAFDLIEESLNSQFAGHDSTIVDIKVCNKDPQCFFSASLTGQIKMWKFSEYNSEKTFDCAVGELAWICISPDDKTLVSCHATGEVFVWDVDTGTNYLVHKHTSDIKCVAFSPDGDSFSIAGDYGTIIIFKKK
jgi:WD40 repeat protein